MKVSMTILFNNPHHEDRPWGNEDWFTINEPSTVKLITVKAGEAFSLQTHQQREEFWHIISGAGIVHIGDKELALVPGNNYFVPKETAHRITATGADVTLLEIAIGAFDENDITRLDDRYGRV